MENTVLQLAKREVQEFMNNRSQWIVILAAGTILGLAGPFGTEDVLRPAPRIVYWCFVAALTFVSGSVLSPVSTHLLQRVIKNQWLVSILSGTVIGLAVASELLLINFALFGIGLDNPRYWQGLLINCTLVSIVIKIAVTLVLKDRAKKNAATETAQGSAAEGAAPPSVQTAKLLDRLPFDKRAPLISISVQDHYVEVTTAKGSELLLMRLSDAMLETMDGMQVHRSHWVSLKGIQSVQRTGATANITTIDGRDIPVSRTYVPQLKEAGLLP